MDKSDQAQLPLVAQSGDGFFCRMSSSIANHPKFSMTLIVVLLILVIGMYIYYHGALSFGPYGKYKNVLRGNNKTKRSKQSPNTDDCDDETSRLIESINKSA